MFQDKLTREIAAAAAQIKTEPPKNEVNTKSVEGAVVSIMTNEELKGNQHKIDANKNGKVDAHDFKLLRAKKGKTVQEGIKGAGVGAALGSVAGGPVGAAIGGALGHVAGEVLSSAKNKTKAIGRIIKGPSMADSKMKKEEIEKLDEIGDTAAGQKMLRKVDSRAFYKGGTKAGGKGNMADAGTKTLERTQSRIKKQPSLLSRAAGTVKKVFNREEVEQMDEAFPTVADAKKRMASKESGFEKKKISTGTVYSRKYKAEPEENEEMPKKKAKTMKEMLSIYSTGGAEALVENLMIEEPTNDEYKKEVETAHAKAEGKIRNDKGIAKAAAQGVKMEEVEIEVLDADEINGVQIDNIEERSMTDAEMNKREDIVKSMKKGIQGFKDRYGDKAKNVMYATAAKIAKKD
jgi:hypothetical protein